MQTAFNLLEVGPIPTGRILVTVAAQDLLPASQYKLSLKELEAVETARAFRSPLLLAKHFSKEYQDSKHLHVIDWEFRNLLSSEAIDILIIAAPVRHGKSLYLSKWAPAWYHLTNPYKNTITTSHTASLALSNSAWVRDKVHELAPLVGLKGVDPGKSAKGYWGLDLPGGGECRAAGVGGAIAGFGACMVAGTKVITPNGLRNIEELCAQNPEKVLSFSHEKNKAEFQSVEAVKANPRSWIYRVTTASGRVVEATGDHRFWTIERGYVEASKIATSDHLLSAMPEGVRQKSWRLSQGSSERPGKVLFLQMFGQGAEEALPVWQGGRSQEPCSVFGMHVGSPGAKEKRDSKKKYNSVPSLRKRFSEEGKLCHGLLACMRKAGSLGEDCWREQSKVEGRFCQGKSEAKECKRVSSRKANRNRRRWRLLRSVSWKGQAERAPHRRKCIEQRHQKSCDALRELSYKPSQDYQTQPDKVVMVERLRKKQKVYDIQVATNANFFANGCLVHNCLLTIDDYLKDAKAAYSKGERDKQWDWFLAAASTRLAPGGKLVMLCTRWHSDDLIGRILEHRSKYGLRVRSVTLPALKEDDGKVDPCGRQPGEALWPEQWPVEVLERRKKTSDVWWSALYQGRPSSEGINEFPAEYFANIWLSEEEWPEKYPLLSASYLDPSKAKNEKSDYQAIVYVGYHNGSILVDSSIDRLPTSKMLARWVEWDRERRPKISGCEGNAFQELLIGEYSSVCSELGYAHDDPVCVINTIAKLVRIRGIGPWLSRGLLKFRRTASNELLVQQLKEVPNGGHDDGPDALAGALKLLLRLLGDAFEQNVTESLA